MGASVSRGTGYAIMSGDSTSGTNTRSGFIMKEKAAPTRRSNMAQRNGIFQLPVRSIRKPVTIGDRKAANEPPTHIRPVAVPLNWCAIYIGTDHLGPIVNSQKNS